jgi:hypothetical protein
LPLLGAINATAPSGDSAKGYNAGSRAALSMAAAE